MPDNIVLPGEGDDVAADEVTDPNLGTVKVQYLKVMDGTNNGTTKATVGSNGLHVDVRATTARVNTSDSMSVAQDTSALMDNLTKVTPKFASISASASGDSAVVAAVSGKKIRVLSLAVVSTSANVVKFRSATTDITGAMSFAANSGLTIGYNPLGHFQNTVANQALNINLGSANQVSGFLTYVEV